MDTRDLILTTLPKSFHDRHEPFLLEVRQFEAANFSRKSTPKTSFHIQSASHPRISSDRKCGFNAGTFLVELAKLNLACPEDTIGEKHFSNNSSTSLFSTVSKNFSDVWPIFWLDFQNWLQRLQGRLLAEKDFLEWKPFFPFFSDFQLMIFGLRANYRKCH